jgi:hypothetical protein
MPIHLLDQTGQKIGDLENIAFDSDSSAFVGRVINISLPDTLRQMLSLLEELVEGQSFTHVDEVQNQIDNAHLIAVFEDEGGKKIRDLYINRDGGISFRLEKNIEV